MHLVRLMRTELEVLQTGELRVRREDAEELSGIRDGRLAFDELLALSSDLQPSMVKVPASSHLPSDVDYERIDALLADVLGIT